MQKNGEGDHSMELQAAWRKFESLCNSLENEHNRLQELERKRQKLNENLESLRNDLKEAQDNLSEDMVNKTDYTGTKCCVESNEVKSTFNADAIRELIRNERKELASEIQKKNLNCSDEDNNQLAISDACETFEDKNIKELANEDDFKDSDYK